MPIETTSKRRVPAEIHFQCTVEDRYFVTDGTEQLKQAEVEGDGTPKSETVWGLRCPACGQAIITFTQDMKGEYDTSHRALAR